MSSLAYNSSLLCRARSTGKMAMPARAETVTGPPEQLPVSEALTAAQEKVCQLEIAVEHRTVIGQAVGVLMERHDLDPETAFEALAELSQHTNRKLYEILPVGGGPRRTGVG
jgi:hypothetical protein